MRVATGAFGFLVSTVSVFDGIVSRLTRVILNGEVDRTANRLGAGELALRHYVGASCFCLHFCWNGALPEAYITKLRVDIPSVRHGIHVLDLLSARSALADLG